MSPSWGTGLLCLVALTATHAIPEPSAAAQQPSASAQPSAAAQLSGLLGPAVEAAVSRALAAERAAQQRCAGDAGQRALGRLEERLDVLSREVTELHAALASVQEAAAVSRTGDNKQGEKSGLDPEPKPEPEEGPEPGPEPEPDCDLLPSPLSAVSASHGEPERRACARSCLQLRNQGGSPRDGIYWFTAMPVPVLCDFSHDGGGWTLLLTAVSKQGWDPFSVLGRKPESPSLTDNYSILQYADSIRDLGTTERFAYRIEARAEEGRQRWGGVWFAPRQYSFIDQTGSQTDVRLARRFDNWRHRDTGIEKRMPWINTGGHFRMYPVLTTTRPGDNDWWGTLVSHASYDDVEQSAWISPEATSSGVVLYWMKEDWLDV